MTIDRSSETAFEPEHETISRGWDDAIATLRRRYPDASDGILFCVHKLQQDPTLSLRDFRKEAQLYKIPLGGRSLHSARVLLGLEKPAAKRNSKRNNGNVEAKNAVFDDRSLEDQVIQAVTQIQEAATEQSHRLRTAIREAMMVLRKALDD